MSPRPPGRSRRLVDRSAWSSARSRGGDSIDRSAGGRAGGLRVEGGGEAGHASELRPLRAARPLSLFRGRAARVAAHGSTRGAVGLGGVAGLPSPRCSRTVGAPRCVSTTRSPPARPPAFDRVPPTPPAGYIGSRYFSDAGRPHEWRRRATRQPRHRSCGINGRRRRATGASGWLSKPLASGVRPGTLGLVGERDHFDGAWWSRSPGDAERWHAPA